MVLVIIVYLHLFEYDYLKSYYCRIFFILQRRDKLSSKNKKPDPKMEKLERIIEHIGFGELRVIIQEGKPIRVEELKKSIKL